jgi:hypothetical protein
MHSSTSSFKPSDTAPSYQREIPLLDIGRAWLIALLFCVIGVGLWEWKWRAFGVEPTIRNSDGLWAMHRRRISNGEGDKTVLIGSSRVLFDVQLPVWERIMGERPIQLALEGTSPIFALEDLADDPKFTGRLLVGVSPPLFFSGFDLRVNAVRNWSRETPSQRFGQWLSMTFLEPFLAFYDDDFRLMTVWRRQTWWPPRAGVFVYTDVRRLASHDRDRNTRLWDKFHKDPEYTELAKNIWRQIFRPPPGVTPEIAQRTAEEQLNRAVAAIEKLKARGVQVIFLRPPSDGEFLQAENGGFPRERTWNVLLERTGVPGIHFEDYPELQGLDLPEWSHLSAADAERFTERLCAILQREHGWMPKQTGS